MRSRAFLVALSVLMPLAGCALMGGGEKVRDVYTLHPPEVQGESHAGAKAITIGVAPPELPSGFDTDRIVLFRHQGRIQDHYAGAAWSSQLTNVLQDFMIGMARHEFPQAVVDRAAGLPSVRYELRVRVTDFEPVYVGEATDTPQIHVGLTLTLVRMPDGKTVAQQAVDRTVAASGNTLTAVTEGLEALLRSLTQEGLDHLSPYLGGVSR
jgi:ABC-type uncharacterized transport system auxiliary subunit